MRIPDTLILQPRRHDYDIMVTLLHGVIVASTNPLVNTYIHVMSKGWSISFPHLKCRMIAPAFGSRSVSKNVVKLHSLNTLLAEFKGGGNLVPPQSPQKRGRVGRFA
jgi:hypothetical protein